MSRGFNADSVSRVALHSPSTGDELTSVPVTAAVPLAANILNGSLTHTLTTGAATLLTVPAGRTWVGKVTIGCAVANAGGSGSTAGVARGVIATAGTNVTPAAATQFAREAKCGANVATGTVGSQGANNGQLDLVVIAPVGNAVTLTLATTITGTSGVVDATAAGELVAA